MILDNFNLNGKTAIVTGSSTGLGQGISIALAEAGANVVGVDYIESPETQKIIEDFSGKYTQCVANLFTTEPVQRIIDEALAAYGSIDILVNNAGIIRRCPAENFTEKDWDDVMNINIKTLFFLSQAVGNQFLKQGKGGKIINMASMLSYQGGINVVSYTASKSAVRGITMTLSNEWAKHGINVNAIAPGYMATNNTTQLRADEGRSKEILDRIPAGRWGLPSDLAGAAVFLASSASDYVDGAVIPIDGGWLGR